MTEDKTYVCDVCGQEFDDGLALGRHKRTHKKESKSKGEGGTKALYLSPEELEELKETERANRQLEMETKRIELEVRRAKALAELRKFESNSEAPKEKTWVLPDGTSFQGSSADYRDMLQTFYQVQAVAKKSTSGGDGETETVKLLKEELRQLREQVANKEITELKNQVNYIANRDPMEIAEQGLQRFNQMAQKEGLIKAGKTVQDAIMEKKWDLTNTTATTLLKSIDKKLDLTMDRNTQMFKTFTPLIEKVGSIWLDDFRTKHAAAMGEPVPIPEEEILKMAAAAQRADIMQETDEKPQQKPEPEKKPEKKSSPSNKKFTYTPRPDLKGHDLDDGPQ